MTDDTLLELATPMAEALDELEAMGADLGTFALYYAEAEKKIDEFALVVLARLRSGRAQLGAGEARLIAARSLLAQSMIRETSHRLDAQNERAQMHRELEGLRVAVGEGETQQDALAAAIDALAGLTNTEVDEIAHALDGESFRWSDITGTSDSRTVVVVRDLRGDRS